MKRNLVRLVTVAVSALLLGCGGGAHLSDSYGRSTRANFERQRIASEVKKDSPSGLDSEEAAIIHGQYRESIGAPKSRAQAEEAGRVLIVEEPARAPRK